MKNTAALREGLIKDILELIDMIPFSGNLLPTCSCWKNFEEDAGEEFRRRLRHLFQTIGEESEDIIILGRDLSFGPRATQEFNIIKEWILSRAKNFEIYLRYIVPWYTKLPWDEYSGRGFDRFTCRCEERKVTTRPTVDPDDY